METVRRPAVQEFVEFREKYNVPVWLGESGENSDEWIKAFRELNETNQIGWCFWTYKRLNATATLASIKRLPEWDEIVKFSEAPRAGFDEIRKARPSTEKSRSIMNEYLENIKFDNCRINEGYLRALGLK